MVNCPKLTTLCCVRQDSRQDRRPDIHLENLPLLSNLEYPPASAMTFKQLDAISHVMISPTELKKFTLAEMPLLERIHINNVTLPSKAFENLPLLPKLERIHITNSRQRNENGEVVPLPGEAIAALGKQPAMKRLSFRQQFTVNDALPELKEFSSLTHIRIEHCNVTDEAVRQLPIAKQLTAFMVIDGEMTGTSLKVFVGGKLETLCLQDCQLNEEGMQYFSRLPQLDQVNLSQSTIENKHLRHLTHLYKLKYLCLAHTEIGDEGMRHVACLPNLNYASYDLFATKVSEEFQKVLPRR